MKFTESFSNHFLNNKTINVNGLKIYFNNFYEAFNIYNAIFLHHEYQIDIGTQTPFILDCGSHIGLSVMYFKKKFPNSKIIAFEPYPDTFRILKKNIKNNNFSDIKTVCAAITAKDGQTKLVVEKKSKSQWTWGNTTVINPIMDKNRFDLINVKSVKLSSFIDRKIDLIKLDVEGCETEILKEIAYRLNLVRNIIIEYHPDPTNKKNDINEIVNLLTKNRFKYNISILNREIQVDEIRQYKNKPLIRAKNFALQ